MVTFLFLFACFLASQSLPGLQKGKHRWQDAQKDVDRMKKGLDEARKNADKKTSENRQRKSEDPIPSRPLSWE
jgi:hypothetical protein